MPNLASREVAACTVVAASSQRMGPPQRTQLSRFAKAGGDLKAAESCGGLGTTSDRNLEWLETTPK